MINYKKAPEKCNFYLRKWYQKRIAFCEKRMHKFAKRFYLFGGDLLLDVKYR